MRKLIVSNMITPDGYYEAPDKNVMPLFDYRFDAYPADGSFDEYNAERLRAADTLLLGRTSYVGFKSFWPPVANNENAPPVVREISRLNNAIDKVVVSDSLAPEETAPWHNTLIVSRAEAHEQVAELKHGQGAEILVFGSRTLWNDLLTHGLVDELHLMISPVVLGAGTPAFAARRDVSLRLIGTRTWEDSGNVLVKYSVRRRGT